MKILYSSEALEALCTNERKAKKTLGPDGFKKLRARLADFEAATRVTELVGGRLHPLKGDRKGQLAFDLAGACRLVFEAAIEPVPKKDDGSIAWSEVTAVRIVFIGDYHG